MSPDEPTARGSLSNPASGEPTTNGASGGVADRPGWWMDYVNVSTTQPIRVSTDGLFNFDEAVLTPAADTLLTEVLELARAAPEGLRMDITGHADLVGCEAEPRKLRYCLELSERRALAVKDWMVTHGVPEDAITTRGAGSLQPLTHDPAPDAQAENRRIEFRLERAGS